MVSLIWFGFEAVLVADLSATSAVFCFPYLDTVCLFLGESLCHRNLGLIYQHKMRLITPLKCSASLVLQHQVLPQKTGEKEAQKFLVAVCLMCPHVGDKEDASACGRSPNPLQRHCGQQRFASWWLHVRPSHMENKQKVKTTLSLDLVSSVSSCLTFMESSSSCLLPWMLFFFFFSKPCSFHPFFVAAK